MKQKFLMLLAAVLLGSASAFAQSGNKEPLKGDVNGDGKVDIADIVAIIDIMKNGESESDGKMYFYYGLTQPTAENYKSIASEVTEYPSEIEFMPESGRVYLYILVKKDMAVEVIDAALNAPAYISEDYNTIPGYKIVRPNSKIGGKVYIRIKPAE